LCVVGEVTRQKKDDAAVPAVAPEPAERAIAATPSVATRSSLLAVFAGATRSSFPALLAVCALSSFPAMTAACSERQYDVELSRLNGQHAAMTTRTSCGALHAVRAVTAPSTTPGTVVVEEATACVVSRSPLLRRTGKLRCSLSLFAVRAVRVEI
jgi:hypothetical protein